jgi:hypothetical protein
MAQTSAQGHGTETDFLVSKQQSFHGFVKLVAYVVAAVAILLLLLTAFLL